MENQDRGWAAAPDQVGFLTEATPRRTSGTYGFTSRCTLSMCSFKPAQTDFFQPSASQKRVNERTGNNAMYVNVGALTSCAMQGAKKRAAEGNSFSSSVPAIANPIDAATTKMPRGRCDG